MDVEDKKLVTQAFVLYNKMDGNGLMKHTYNNFSSCNTKMILPAYGLYSASKAAVEQITRVFSKEICRGITVNAIAP